MTERSEPIVHVAVDDGVDPELAAIAQDEASAVLSALGLPGGTELSLYLVNDPKMQELNRTWRDLDRPTDVLSFPQDAGGGLLGDVVVDVEAVHRQSEAHGLSRVEELRFLLIHGVLHLLGHDHHETDERTAMEAQEQRVWEALGGVGRIR